MQKVKHEHVKWASHSQVVSSIRAQLTEIGSKHKVDLVELIARIMVGIYWPQFVIIIR